MNQGSRIDVHTVQMPANIIVFIAKGESVGKEGTSHALCVTGIPKADHEPRKSLANGSDDAIYRRNARKK
jgi:hypothetical protein